MRCLRREKPRSGHAGTRVKCLIAVGALLVANDASAAPDNGGASQVAAAQFRENHPQAELSRSNRGITRVHGSAFEHGDSPEHAAQLFVDARSQRGWRGRAVRGSSVESGVL